MEQLQNRVIGRPDLPPGEPPRVITLCGSTRFADEYKRVTRELTLAGWVVISVGLFGHQEGLDMTGPEKTKLDHLHLWKIAYSEAVFIINPDHCIGSSTQNELNYACKTGKRIYSLERLQPGSVRMKTANGFEFWCNE